MGQAQRSSVGTGFESLFFHLLLCLIFQFFSFLDKKYTGIQPKVAPTKVALDISIFSSLNGRSFLPRPLMVRPCMGSVLIHLERSWRQIFLQK